MRKPKVSARSQPAARGASTLENPYNFPNWHQLSEEERRFYRGFDEAVQKAVERKRRTGKMFDWDEEG